MWLIFDNKWLIIEKLSKKVWKKRQKSVSIILKKYQTYIILNFTSRLLKHKLMYLRYCKTVISIKENTHLSHY